MKFIFLFLVTGFLWACTGNDPQAVNTEKIMKDTANYTTIEWMDSASQSLGKVDQGAVVEIKWHFKNTGNKPLVVENVRPGCGCTGAEGPKEPIPPGKEGEITAKFDTKNYPGEQHKEVYVTANNRNKTSETQDVLRFSVEVQPKQ